jgi:hypothetical protein
MAAVRFAWQIVPPASSATAGGTFPLKTGEPQFVSKCLILNETSGKVYSAGRFIVYKSYELLLGLLSYSPPTLRNNLPRWMGSADFIPVSDSV